jgi:hypothetical protein
MTLRGVREASGRTRFGEKRLTLVGVQSANSAAKPANKALQRTRRKAAFIVEQLEKHPGVRSSRLFVISRSAAIRADPIIRGVSSVAFVPASLQRLSSDFVRCRASKPRWTGLTSASWRSDRAQRPLWTFVMVLRTFQDLCRAVEVGDVVTRSISGHATEAMQRHYSTASLEEQRRGWLTRSRR